VSIQAAIAHAFAPDDYVIAGVRLRPLSVGHVALLERCQSSFVTGEDHTIGDLLTSVLVCSAPHEDALARLKSGELQREVMRWQRRLSGGLRGRILRGVRLACGEAVTPQEVLGLNLKESAAHFESYIEAHGGNGRTVNEWACPSCELLGEGATFRPSLPEWALLLAGLIADLSCSKSDALNTPIVEARWMLAALGERRCALRVRDVEEWAEEKRQADEFAANKH
jgi:hypothetical protein